MSDRRISKLLAVPLLTSLAVAAFGGAVCRAEQRLQLTLVGRDLLGERLRAGSVRGKERQAAVQQLFQQAGCHTTLQAIDKRSANVICDLPGETNSALIVGAHFDFVNEGQGIVDDWSGVSMLVSLYQTFKWTGPRHSYEFVAFAGEERGLVGSTHYVKELGARSNFVPQAFINLECLGLSSPKVWVTRSNPLLVRRLAEVANAMQIPVRAMNVDKVGDDDTHPFLSKNVPVISIHSLTQETFPILHSKRDNIDAINPSDYYDAYRLAAFYLNFLDAKLSPETTPAAADGGGKAASR